MLLVLLGSLGVVVVGGAVCSVLWLLGGGAFFVFFNEGSQSHRKIGGLGELERFILPPVTGRSASFRLRFRFVRVVRAVRAGEAKLRGRMTSDVLIAGLPG